MPMFGRGGLSRLRDSLRTIAGVAAPAPPLPANVIYLNGDALTLGGIVLIIGA